MRLNLCCGENRLPGWINHDMDCDIRKPLPYPDHSALCVFVEHGLEHVSHQQAWNLIEECHRILLPGGVLRIAIPDLSRMNKHMTQEYADAVKKGGHGDGTFKSALKACVFEHGHQAAWNATLLSTFMSAIGLKPLLCRFGESKHEALKGIEGHGRVVGTEIARLETSIVEGTKI